MIGADTRYRLGPLIGQGGSSLVYQAWERLSGREVALKMLHPAVLRQKDKSGRMLERFIREASVMATVRHPSMVQIYDFGFLDGAPFIAMERLHGAVLKQVLRKNGAFPPAQAWPLFLGVLGALSICHGQGIVHKDLKPENLFLVDQEGEPTRLVVFDFGFAHTLDTPRMSAEGSRFGTAHYLAPEYIEGGVATPAMDVYQMGLVLVEMLTGQRVIREMRSVPAMERILDGRLELADSLRSGVLGVVIEHALERDPEHRFPNAQAFHDALVNIEPDTLHALI